MNLRLFTGPSRPAILTELFRRVPIGTGRVCAIVPDSESAHRLEQLIARQNGGSALGIRVHTFDRLARDICALDRVPPAVIPNYLRRALIHELIGSRIGGDSRWRTIADSPGFASLVSSYLEDIRSGIADDNGDPDLTALSRAYDSHLARLGRTDHEGFIRLALEGGTVERFASSFDGPLIVEGFYDLTPCQFELTARLAASFRRSAVCVVNDNMRPGLFSLPRTLIEGFRELGAELTDVPMPAPSPCSRVLASFMNGTEPSPEPDVTEDDVAVHTFRSVRAEADWIAGTIRRLITDGVCPARDIMVVTRQTPAGNDPIVTMLHRHDVPVKNGTAHPLAIHPLTTCILAALDASINPTEEALDTVRRSSYTSPVPSSGGTVLPSADIRGWSSMIADTDSPAGFAESMARMIDALGIGDVVNSGDDAGNDKTVYQQIIDSFGEFASFYRPLRPMMGSREFSRLFRRFIGEIQVRDNDTDGGVLLTGIMHARYADRPVVFMTGLDNTSYPVSHDRFVLHPPGTVRTLSERREREEPLLFLAAMSGARRLYLTYPGIDDEGGDAGMSPYLRELITRAGAQDRMIRHTGIPGAAWEEGASTRRGQLEETVRALNAADSGTVMQIISKEGTVPLQPVRDAFSRFAAIADKNGYRLTHPVTLSAIGHEWSGETPLPVTAVEHYRTCPVSFFFQHLLRIEIDTPPENSLDNRERGSIVHDALARFYTVLAENTGSMILRRGVLDRAQVIMEQAVDDAFAAWRRELTRLNPQVVAAERLQIKRWMNEIVSLEADLQSVSPFVPFRFETPFGTKDVPPLVVEADGERAAFRGRIDRIDRAPGTPPRFRVIDYKTGQGPAKRELDAGEVLQLPLYLKAVAEVLYPGGETGEGMYFTLRTAAFDETKGRLSGCLTVGGDSIDEVTESASRFAVEAVHGIRSGVFAAPETCNRVCSFKPLCRGGMTGEEGGIDADR